MKNPIQPKSEQGDRPNFKPAIATEISIQHFESPCVSEPIGTSVANWQAMLRQVQHSVGAWGCDLLELRRANRLVPSWAGRISTTDLDDCD